MKRNRILLFVAIHERPLTTRICFEGIRRLMDYKPDKFLIEPFIVYSNGEDAAIPRQYKFLCMQAPNRPLSMKMNLGLEAAMNLGNKYDYLMQLGGDDILKPEVLDIYDPLIAKRCPFFGMNSIYFYDAINNRIKKHYQRGVFGAGRCIRYDVAESMMESGGLWSDNKNAGLDYDSELRIYEELGFHDHYVRHVSFKDPVVLDIKDGYNIWSYDQLPGEAAGKSTEQVLSDFGWDDLLHAAGESELESRGVSNL